MTKSEAIAEIERVAGTAFTLQDIDDLSCADDNQLRKILQGWLDIQRVRDSSALSAIGTILSKVAEWAPLALKIAGMAAVL
jgi:hypothetical protein